MRDLKRVFGWRVFIIESEITCENQVGLKAVRGIIVSKCSYLRRSVQMKIWKQR